MKLNLEGASGRVALRHHLQVQIDHVPLVKPLALQCQ